MPHHHAQHVQDMGPNLFAHNENSAYVMPHVTTHAVMSYAHHVVCTHRQAGDPMYMWCARNYLWTCRSQKPNNIYQN